MYVGMLNCASRIASRGPLPLCVCMYVCMYKRMYVGMLSCASNIASRGPLPLYVCMYV